MALLAFVGGGVTMHVLAHFHAASVAASQGPPSTSPAVGAAPATSAAQPVGASTVANEGSDVDSAAGGEDDNADDWPANAPSPEQVLYAQHRMMEKAVGELTPRVPGKPNLWVIAFAGDGGEDVFRNEAEYAQRLFARRFDAQGHVLVLQNNPATLDTRPLATWSNLETALDGVAARMDRGQDILLLYLTSHGTEDHTLLVDMNPLPLDQLDPDGLAQMLSSRHIRYKVVVVNACYSGGFLPSLRGDGTAVLTAARSDRSSFGCGSDSDITYFGHAWLVDGLNQTDDILGAFANAKKEISQWEQRDKLTPSEPQLDLGFGIAAQLEKWRTSHKAGPTIGFSAAK
ncbi:C13 family peptidase [Pinirhizobacter sp.]|uniref:C13 family peptidase n=1 Tax=Pinirhizobacter sp. TaxID=2950432 RepID=UPI0039C99DB2